MIYALFATSKRVTIDAVAVMSLQVGNTITRVLEKHPQPVVRRRDRLGRRLPLRCDLPGHRLPPSRLGHPLHLRPRRRWFDDGQRHHHRTLSSTFAHPRVKFETRPAVEQRYASRGDRPWNDPGPPNPYFVKAFRAITCAGARRRLSVGDVDGSRPTINRSAEHGDAPWYGTQSPDGSVGTRPVLRALIFDFSVSNMDTSGAPSRDTRADSSSFTSPRCPRPGSDVACSPVGLVQARRTGRSRRSRLLCRRHEYLTREEVNNANEAAEARRRAQAKANQGARFEGAGDDIEKGSTSSGEGAVVPVLGEKVQSDWLDDGTTVPVIWATELTPFFHLDLPAALDSVVRED
ncbi:hypothetical protein V8E36_002524 [Tilletia maclaganii]